MILFQTLCHTLDEEGWDYEYDDKNELLRFRVHGVNIDFNVLLIIDEEQESLLCNTYIVQKVPEDKRFEVCEFINRINYELDNGNLEMDMEDGEIRYRTFLDLSDASPSKEQILNMEIDEEPDETKKRKLEINQSNENDDKTPTKRTKINDMMDYWRFIGEAM